MYTWKINKIFPYVGDWNLIIEKGWFNKVVDRINETSESIHTYYTASDIRITSYISLWDKLNSEEWFILGTYLKNTLKFTID